MHIVKCTFRCTLGTEGKLTALGALGNTEAENRLAFAMSPASRKSN
jgi:methyl coenzyme M reductase subunit C